MYVEDIKLAGKKQNMNPMWKAQTTEVDLGEPTSFLDHVYSGRTQRECQISKDIVDNTEVSSNQGFLPGPWKNTRHKSHGET